MGLVWVGVGGGTGGNANAVIWKKNNKMIYPELNPISWNDYGNSDIQTLANFLEDNFHTIEDGIDEGGVALLTILDFSRSGSLLCKVEKSWRWVGTTAVLGGLYITPLDVDLLDQTPCVIFISSGSIPVIWKKESGMIYPQIASFDWGSISGDGTLLGNWTIDDFASKLSEQYNTILEALSHTTGGVGLVHVTWGEPMDNFSTYVKVELSWSDTYMNSRPIFVATPLVGTNISGLACKIYISNKHDYVVIRKEEVVETGLPKIELVIPGNIDTQNLTTATDVYPYIKEQFESLGTLMSGKNAAELKVSFEGSSDYWGFFVYKSTSKHSGVNGMETDVYKIEPYTNSFGSAISYEMKYLYMVKSGDELIAKVLTYQAGMADV